MADKEVTAVFGSDGFTSGNIRTGGDVRLSPHFTAAEFACPCCGEYKVHKKLLEGLELLREKVGHAIRVVNPKAPGGQGYRCKNYAVALAARNKTAAVNTKHNLGTAADINANFCKTAPTALKRIAESIPQFRDGGIGLYSWGIHVDLGPKRRWKY